VETPGSQNPGVLTDDLENAGRGLYLFFFAAFFLAAGFFAAFFLAAMLVYLLLFVIGPDAYEWSSGSI
jgi:hypothetical protein